ncbi:hypothetical protein RKD37_000345 [Streptomyces ambofaciens]
MELVEADRVDAEPAGGLLGSTLGVCRIAVARPRAVAGTQVAPLGRDEDIGGTGPVLAQCAGDELLVVAHLVRVTVVGVGRVDEGDADVERSVDSGDRPFRVRASLDRHRHSAEPDRGDGPVT